MFETRDRRTDRVLINMPVSISGTDAGGKPFAEVTTTVSVSLHGASIALKRSLVPGQEITIHRLRTAAPRTAICQVGDQAGQQGNLTVFGIAFRTPAVGFWDIYFPQLPPNNDTAGRALLECKVCRSRKIVHLNSFELRGYSANRELSLSCEACGKITIWLGSHQDPVKRPIPMPANATRLAASSSPTANKRKHRRVAAEIPVCIRQEGSDDDLTTTVDISRGGLRFSSRRRYITGSYVQVAIPYSASAANVFVDALIAHCSEASPQNLYRFGIMYVAENHPWSSGGDVMKNSDDREISASAE